jgi:N-acetylmuramic acid 6-phosphate etherase
MNLDAMSALEIITVMNREDAKIPEAIKPALPHIAQCVNWAIESVEAGGRIIYMGAGTSGRLGVLDAVECPPTFGADPSMVQGIIAGGQRRMFAASENEEDKDDKGRLDVEERGVSAGDVVVGVSVAGGAAYVVGALEKARELGASTIALTCNDNSPIAAVSDLAIVTDTGAEVITGSTRLKAGTAHKMVMNMLTTCAMVKTGRVYENMMVNLKPYNIKLRQRVINIVCDICHCDREKAVELRDAFRIAQKNGDSGK